MLDQNFDKIEGIYFLKLKGSRQERVRQYSLRLKDEILNGPIPKLAKKNQGMIRRSPGILQWKPAQNAVVALYEKILLPIMARKMFPQTREVLEVLSEVTGLPYSLYREGFFQSEGILMISSLAVMQHLMHEVPAALLGCSSAVVLGKKTITGSPLVVRNMDYPIIGPWEKVPVVCFHEPSESDLIPHVTFTSAGVYTAGLTTLNAEGLTLASHAHFRREFSFRGSPVLPIGEEIITRAKTIGQAVDIAKKYRRCAGWGFVISSAKENDAVVLELTSDQTIVRPAEDGFITHSNYAQSPAIKGSEAAICGGYLEDLTGRVCRLKELISSNTSLFSPQDLLLFLGDHVDPLSGEERVFGNTVSVITTVTSVGLDPANQKAWISTRKESPTGLGDFIEIDINRFWSMDSQSRVLSRAKGYQPKNLKLFDGIKAYREAYKVWHMDLEDPDYVQKTVVHLRKAAELFPQDGNLWTELGLVSFFGHQFEVSRHAFEQARSRKLSPHTQMMVELFLARDLDLTGRRQEALALYSKNREGVIEPKLKKAFEQGVKTPFKQHRVERMILDLQFPDTMIY